MSVAAVDRDYLLRGEVETIPVRQIQLEICAKYKIKLIDLLSERRMANLSVPRQEGYYRARHETTLSLPQIARAFRRLDHQTIIHGIRQHERRINGGEQRMLAGE